MNAFIKYLQDFFREIPRRDFFLITVFAAALISLNYGLKIERQIRTASDWYLSLALFYLQDDFLEPWAGYGNDLAWYQVAVSCPGTPLAPQARYAVGGATAFMGSAGP